MLERYLPFRVTKVHLKSQSQSRYVCGECDKGFYNSRGVIDHQRTDCIEFREKHPDVDKYEVNLTRGRPKKSVFSEVKKEKMDMDEELYNPEPEMSEHSKVQPKTEKLQKTPYYERPKQSTYSPIPGAILQKSLIIDPLPNRPANNLKIISSGDLIANYRSCVFKSFSILTLGQQKFHLQEFQDLLSTFRFQRFEGVSFGEVKENYYEYSERAKSTITELLKLHANKKQRFLMVLGQNLLLVDFFWRKDEPQIILTSKQEAFGDKQPYIELLRIQKSKLFKVLDIVCIHARGMNQVREVWEKILKLINMNIPFTAISNHPFDNAFKAIPIIRQQPEQVTKEYFRYFNILSPSKSVFKQRILGYTTATNLYAFCMAIMDRGRCLIEVEFAEMSEIIQRVWNTTQSDKIS